MPLYDHGMNEPEYQAPLPPCDKCGLDTPESRTSTPIEPVSKGPGVWQRHLTKCSCGHEFLTWHATLEVAVSATPMRRGTIENVIL